MSRWVLAGVSAVCGYDGAVIPLGTPMQIVLGHRVRCAAHATGPVNHDEIDAALRAREAQLERDAVTAEATPSPARTIRQRPVRRPSSFASLRDVAATLDPKRLAAGDRD